MDSKISKKWLTKLILIMAVFILVASALSCTSSSPPDPTPPESNKAPDFTLSTLAGDEITLSELEGPVVLNFWATWCVYCAEEMRYFNAVAKQRPGEITVVAINVGQDASQVKQYFGDYKTSFTVALDKDRNVASMYAIRYFPTTFFIDSEGIVRNRKIGAFRSEMELWDSLRDLA
jgi:thiol-disulfide isomerase/thioredoxin